MGSPSSPVLCSRSYKSRGWTGKREVTLVLQSAPYHVGPTLTSTILTLCCSSHVLNICHYTAWWLGTGLMVSECMRSQDTGFKNSYIYLYTEACMHRHTLSKAWRIRITLKNYFIIGLFKLFSFVKWLAFCMHSCYLLYLLHTYHLINSSRSWWIKGNVYVTSLVDLSSPWY